MYLEDLLGFDYDYAINNPNVSAEVGNNKNTLLALKKDIYIPYNVLNKDILWYFPNGDSFGGNYLKNYNFSNSVYIVKDNVLYIILNGQQNFNNFEYHTPVGSCPSLNAQVLSIDLLNYNVDFAYYPSRCYNSNNANLNRYYKVYKFTASSLCQTFKCGNSYLEDLMYSNKTTDIVITFSFYMLIPLIIVLYLYKTFRKGIH